MWNRLMKSFLPLSLMILFVMNVGIMEKEETKVWIVESTSSQCYHIDKNCRTLKSATHPIKSVTLQEAKTMGKRACKVCTSK